MIKHFLQRYWIVSLVGVLVLSVVLVAGIGIPTHFIYQARQETKAAQLTNEAWEVFNVAPQRSILLTLEAANIIQRLGETPAPEIETLLRHELANTGGQILGKSSHSINTAVISPNGKWLATTINNDQTVSLWSLDDPAARAILLNGHTDYIYAALFSPDNHWLATASFDATIRLWNLTAADPASGSLLLNQPAPSYPGSIAFSHAGGWLAYGGSDGKVRFWKMAGLTSGEAPILVNVNMSLVDAIAFSPDDQHLVVSGMADKTTLILDMQDPSAEPVALPVGSGLLAVSPDGHWLALADFNHVHVWDMTYLDAAPLSLPIPIDRTDNLNGLTFSPDSRWLLTTSLYTSALLWNFSGTTPTATSLVLDGGKSVVVYGSFSAESHWLFGLGSNGSIQRWDMTAPDPAANVTSLGSEDDGAYTLLNSPDGRWLVTAGSTGVIRRWDMQHPATSPLVLTLPSSSISAMATSADSHWLAAGSNDGTIYIWDLANPLNAPLSLTGQKGAITGLTFTRKHPWLVSGSWDGTLRIWDMSASDPAAKSLVLDAGNRDLSGFAMSPDEAWLAESIDNANLIHLWDMRSQTPTLLSLRGDEAQGNIFNSMIFSPDSTRLAAIDNQNVIHLWTLTGAEAGFQQIRLNDPIASAGDFQILFSSDSRTLILGDRDNIIDWDLTTHILRPILRGGSESDLVPIALSPDNHWLVSGSTTGLVRIWNMKDISAGPHVLHSDGAVDSIAISPDSQRLITGNQTNNSRIWDLNNISAGAVILSDDEPETYLTAFSPDNRWIITAGKNTIRLRPSTWTALVELACQTVGRNLSIEEWQEYFGNAAYRATCPTHPAATPVNTAVTPVPFFSTP